MIKYYQSFDSKNGIKYSLDMVRLSIDFNTHTQNFCDYMTELASVDLRYEVAYFQSFKKYSYKHLWNVKDSIDDTVSWTVGLDYGGTKDGMSQGFLEFNPNKCMDSPLFLDFLEVLRANSPIRDLVRYDMAIDIPLPLGQCKLHREGKRTYQYIQKDDGITEYLGQRSHSGFVKLYDKTIESDLDFPLTRLEITYDKKELFEKVFPTVHIVDMQSKFLVDDTLDSTDKALISLLRDCPDRAYYLSQLGRRKRKKIEPYLADRVLLLDKYCAHSVYALAMSFEK